MTFIVFKFVISVGSNDVVILELNWFYLDNFLNGIFHTAKAMHTLTWQEFLKNSLEFSRILKNSWVPKPHTYKAYSQPAKSICNTLNSNCFSVLLSYIKGSSDFKIYSNFDNFKCLFHLQAILIVVTVAFIQVSLCQPFLT